MRRTRVLQRSNSYQLHKIHNYIVGDEISKGMVSSIRESFHQENWGTYAVRMISKKKLMELANFNEIAFSDMVIAPLLVHPHIVRVHQTIESPAHFFHVMDHYHEGNLSKLISQGVVSDGILLQFLDQLLSAIEYLHKRQLSHNDIRPENVLLAPNGVLKLNDFSSTKFASTNIERSCKAKRDYSAPEVFICEAFNGRKADIWSIGVLVYTLFAGFCPFSELENDYKTSELDLSIIPEDVAVFIRDCLQKNPESRPDISKLRLYSCFDALEFRAPSTEDLNYERPMKRHFAPIITRLSEFLSSTPERIIDLLISSGVNSAKILCSLLEDSIRAERMINQSKSQKQIRMRSLSDKDSQFFDNGIEIKPRYEITIRELIGENGYLVLDALNGHVLSKKFCISTSLQGTKTLVYNTEDDEDIKLEIDIEDMPDEHCCFIVIQGDGKTDHIAREFSYFLKSKFPIVA